MWLQQLEGGIKILPMTSIDFGEWKQQKYKFGFLPLADKPSLQYLSYGSVGTDPATTLHNSTAVIQMAAPAGNGALWAQKADLISMTNVTKDIIWFLF